MGKKKMKPWESGSCPLCKSSEVKRVIYRFSIPGEEKKKTGIVQCGVCSLKYLTPRLSEKNMGKVYSDPGYFDSEDQQGYGNYLQQEDGLRSSFRLFLKELQNMGLTGGSLAEIGCGPGYFLEEAAPFFKVRMGSDMSPEIAAIASSRCDKVVCGNAGTLSGQSGRRFDTVVAISVLEHLYDPGAFLGQCREMTRKGGSVVLVMPDFNSRWRRFMGKRWPSFKLPEHIAYYCPETVRFLAGQAGMEVERIFPYHEAFPLNLVLEKLGVKINIGRIGKTKIFLPGVMMAAVLKA
jgi:SAM-dependent methyltransferase